jgi:predicted ATPase
MFSQIRLQNFLSFGPESPALELGPLNVLIGPNGSGKSNLIEAFSLLQAAPRDLAAPIRAGGGVSEWIWKGEGAKAEATIEATVRYPKESMSLRHRLEFRPNNGDLEIVHESIDGEKPYIGQDEEEFYYRFKGEKSIIKTRGDKFHADNIINEDFESKKSILSQKKDPVAYPELSYLSETYEKIKIYRDWNFGRLALARVPQPADVKSDFLQEDFSNLEHLLYNLRKKKSIKERFQEALRAFSGEKVDVSVRIRDGRLEISLKEGDKEIPVSRLSGATLRYLCLLAILCHPEPPPLICLEAPELGLHPDVLTEIADLLLETSERCQIIVTTYSSTLVDAFSNHAECVIVCSKEYNSTVLERLDKTKMKPWLKNHSLGNLWSMGHIGGNRY